MANLVVGIICFIAAVLSSEWCSAQTIVGPSGKPLQGAHSAKCSRSPTGCYEQATRDCKGGSYQIVESESHAGGLFADILPGPVTWYTMSYNCGPSDGRLAEFPFRGPRQSIRTCMQFGDTTTCTGN
jgi:hypothetical protein